MLFEAGPDYRKSIIYIEVRKAELKSTDKSDVNNEKPEPKLPAVRNAILSAVAAVLIFAGLSITPASAQSMVCPMAPFADMQKDADAGFLAIAALEGKYAMFQVRNYCDTPSMVNYAAREQTIFWDMLSPDMQKVLLAHGGTRQDNSDARPTEFKTTGDKDDGKGYIWVYKSGGAVVTTYIFTKGKLTSTLKP